MVLLFILLLWSRFCHLLIVSRLLSLGLGSCLVFKPFKPRPVFGFCMCPSFFCVWFVSSPPCFSCFFFLSGAGETQTPFGGFGVPLVFSSCRTRSPSTTRTSRSAPTSRPRPAPAFFFFFLSSSSSLVSGSVFARPCPVGVGNSRFSWWVFFLPLVSVFLCAQHCKTDLGSCKWGRETRHLPPR